MQRTLNQEVIQLVDKVLDLKRKGKIQKEIPRWVYECRRAANGKCQYRLGLTQAQRLLKEFPEQFPFVWKHVGERADTILVERIPRPPEENPA